MQKKYPSGNIGIIVVEKINGKMNELVTIGIAKSDEEVADINMSVEFLLDTKLTRELNSHMEFVTSFDL